MNYYNTLEQYRQQIESLSCENEELEEVVATLESDYDELAEENDELKLLLYRLHQVIGDISEHFEEYSHLCRTLFGVCTTAAPHLDAHKRRTVKGLVKKTGEQGQELNDSIRALNDLLEHMRELGMFAAVESECEDECDLM